MRNASENTFSRSHERSLYMYACVMVFVTRCIQIVMIESLSGV